MDKNAIKKYAVWARKELITRVSQRAEKYDITAEADASASSVNGVLLSDAEIKQRKALIEQVKQKGFDQVMEEVAYTWFNRFIALRFMEVNGYLPSHIRVFTDDNNNFKPQILAEAIHLELDGLDMEKVYEMKNNNENDELYKYLIITQCNDLNKVLPGMFQKIADYTELLFPDNILREGSVIEKMVVQGENDSIPVQDWKDQVQIVGWLYQYYNSEPKDKVFAELKNNVKIAKEKIPAATQLFTPDWIVRYMVENSLGRLWAEGHPGSTIKTAWNYYLDEKEQESDVRKKLDEIQFEYGKMKPEEIQCIDPCCGSGHILAYMFDVLVQIYEDYGISTRDAVRSIVHNNLWGLDIDDRAAQLAYFSVMMKGMQYDRRFLQRRDEMGNPDVPQPHVFGIRESNDIDEYTIESFCNGDVALKDNFRIIKKELDNAKEFGSIVNVSQVDFDILFKRYKECQNEINLNQNAIEKDIFPLIQVAQTLAKKYHVVVTNPPYMGNGGFDSMLAKFIQEHYAEAKQDLYAVFIKKCSEMLKHNGFQAMITQHSWMFISSFEKLRNEIINNDVINMAHMGPRAFDEIAGEVVQTTAFVLRKSNIDGYVGKYKRLVDYNSQSKKEEAFLGKGNEYVTAKSSFSRFPGNPYVYWVGKNTIKCFNEYPMLDAKYKFREGIHTADNNRFLKVWFEIPYTEMVFDAKSYDDIDKKGRWVPYNKGGKYRKWYGNNEYVIGFDSVYRNEMSKLKGHVRPSQDLYFMEGGTWTAVASGKLGIRFYPEGFLFDAGGQVVVGDHLIDCIALLNTKIYNFFADMLMPTLNYKCGMLKTLPNLILEDEEIRRRAKENIELAKKDWDSFELSWNFKRHPLVRENCSLIEHAFNDWAEECNRRFDRVKENEIYINNAYLTAYGLEKEILLDYEDSDITIAKADLTRDIKSLISYAVGCMFGRYSLDKEGLVFAGGTIKDEYQSYPIDKDNIIPICDDLYFEDDIVDRFIKFLSIAFGKETLEDNIKYVANALGGNGAPREVIRSYFMNDFFSDHCSMYSVTGSGKRPIYWLFDSGKKNGFKCLIYMHRYQTDTLARIRTDYVHELQSRYRTALEAMEKQLLSTEGSEKVKLNKRIKKIKEQSEEIHAYEEKIHHLADQMISIDLDNGVKQNYQLFKDVLSKI